MANPSSPAPAQRPKWMFVVFGIACCVMAATVGVFLYGLTLPDRWSVSESIVIAAPPGEVAAYIESPAAWTEWSMWSASNDPTLETKATGPESGPGATLQWKGQAVGHGKLMITDVQSGEEDSQPAVIEYELYRFGELFSDDGRFELEAAGGKTRVRWTDSGELGNTTARLFRSRLTERISHDYARCLEALGALIESQPVTATSEGSADR